MRSLPAAGLASALILAASALVSAHAERAELPSLAAVDARPLAGRVVVIDPGHQLGNGRFPSEVNRLVPSGRGVKACNTTGTATATGYPEATLTWEVARLVRARLERLGATVELTRDANRDDRWGPCVDVRGRAGNRAAADLELSIHADGSLLPGARGFHVIVAPEAAEGSRGLADALRTALRHRGLPRATYVAGGDGLDVRTDLATLNLSRVPTAMVELGNMRDPVDAGRMTSRAGRATYAEALVAAVRRQLRDQARMPSSTSETTQSARWTRKASSSSRSSSRIDSELTIAAP